MKRKILGICITAMALLFMVGCSKNETNSKLQNSDVVAMFKDYCLEKDGAQECVVYDIENDGDVYTVKYSHSNKYQGAYLEKSNRLEMCEFSVIDGKIMHLTPIISDGSGQIFYKQSGDWQISMYYITENDHGYYRAKRFDNYNLVDYFDIPVDDENHIVYALNQWCVNDVKVGGASIDINGDLSLADFSVADGYISFEIDFSAKTGKLTYNITDEDLLDNRIVQSGNKFEIYELRQPAQTQHKMYAVKNRSTGTLQYIGTTGMTYQSDVGFFLNGDIYVMDQGFFKVYSTAGENAELVMNLADKLPLGDAHDGDRKLAAVRKLPDGRYVALYTELPIGESNDSYSDHYINDGQLNITYKLAVFSPDGQIINQLDTGAKVIWGTDGIDDVRMLNTERGIAFSVYRDGWLQLSARTDLNTGVTTIIQDVWANVVSSGVSENNLSSVAKKFIRQNTDDDKCLIFDITADRQRNNYKILYSYRHDLSEYDSESNYAISMCEVTENTDGSLNILSDTPEYAVGVFSTENGTRQAVMYRVYSEKDYTLQLNENYKPLYTLNLDTNLVTPAVENIGRVQTYDANILANAVKITSSQNMSNVVFSYSPAMITLDINFTAGKCNVHYNYDSYNLNKEIASCAANGYKMYFADGAVKANGGMVPVVMVYGDDISYLCAIPASYIEKVGFMADGTAYVEGPNDLKIFEYSDGGYKLAFQLSDNINLGRNAGGNIYQRDLVGATFDANSGQYTAVYTELPINENDVPAYADYIDQDTGINGITYKITVLSGSGAVVRTIDTKVPVQLKSGKPALVSVSGDGNHISIVYPDGTQTTTNIATGLTT